jgi:hypothetical protein
MTFRDRLGLEQGFNDHFTPGSSLAFGASAAEGWRRPFITQTADQAPPGGTIRMIQRTQILA